MMTDHRDDAGIAPPQRVTRCQLMWAAIFLIGVSLIGWYVIARLLF